MEQEQNNQESAVSANQSTNSQTATLTMDQLLANAQSPKLKAIGAWLICLRKPALSMQYSLQKRHVPDLDTDSGGQQASSTPTANTNQAGKNSDVMGLNGDFTIRYFDLAMGLLGLSMLACFIKGCACIKRSLL